MLMKNSLLFFQYIPCLVHWWNLATQNVLLTLSHYAVIWLQLFVISWIQHHLTLSSNYQSVRESSWFNVRSISDTFLIKSLGRKLLSAAALLLLYRVISNDAFGQQDISLCSKGIMQQ